MKSLFFTGSPRDMMRPRTATIGSVSFQVVKKRNHQDQIPSNDGENTPPTRKTSLFDSFRPRSKSDATRKLSHRRVPIVSIHTLFENHKKVSFNIASEASNVYILGGQKFIKECQKWPVLATFWKPDACSQTVLPDRSILKRQKIGEKGQRPNWNVKMRLLWLIFKQCDSLF